MEPPHPSYQYMHPQAQHHPTIGIAQTVPVCDYFIPKLEVLDSLRVNHHVEGHPPPITELNTTRRNNSRYSPYPLQQIQLQQQQHHLLLQQQQLQQYQQLYHLQQQHQKDDVQRALSSSSSAVSPLSPPYEEESNTFVEAYTKIRSISGELFQCASDALARYHGKSPDNMKMEYYAQELLKLAKQLNNSNNSSNSSNSSNNTNNTNNSNTTIEDDDRKRLPPPLVRPRRIRRKHIEDEEVDENEKKRKLGVPPSAELYCHSCGTTDTPEWRRGPDGCKSLCNACGLHYAKILRRETMIPNRQPARTTMTLGNLLN